MHPPYLPHLSESLRRKIAQGYICHELRKLLPSITDVEVWEAIDRDVANWFSDNILMTPVRGFWNGFYGIARGFRFKNLLPILTSLHISWSEQVLDLDELTFGATFKGLEFLGPHAGISDARKILDRPEHEGDKIKTHSMLRLKGDSGIARDHDPLIIREEEGKKVIIDGNRRAFEAMVAGKKTLLGYVAKPTGRPEIFEQWVPAGFLQDLMALHAGEGGSATEKTSALAHAVAYAIRYSSAGRLEWQALCHVAHDRKDEILGREVARLLKSI